MEVPHQALRTHLAMPPEAHIPLKAAFHTSVTADN
jgi:hypothetical protein